MADNPGDAQGKSVVAGDPAEKKAAPPVDAPGNNAQPTITIGDKKFTADDVEGLFNAKVGLERANTEKQKKLDEIEASKLSDKERLEKEKSDLAAENAALKKSVLTSKIQAALDAKGVKIKADILNLQVTDESQIDTAVQNLIKDYPALVSKASPGTGNVPPGTVPPAGAPPSEDAEAEIRRKFENAKTPQEFEQAEKEYSNLTGRHTREERKAL
jgi:hypothetical protein